VSAFPALDPPRRHNTTTNNSLIYADYCRATSLGCPISQIWTRHRQDNLSVTGAIVSSSATRTKKSQDQDRLARTRVDERRSARGCDRGWGQQVGEEEQGEGWEDERDVRRRRKRWCVHAVKHPRGRAIATARVGVGTGVRRIWGGGVCSHAICREWVARRRRHEGREKKSRMANKVTTTETRTIIIVRRYRWPNRQLWRAGPGHVPFNSVWPSPTRASCRAWTVASTHSADPIRHDYIFFILQKILYTYVHLCLILKILDHNVLLVRQLHSVFLALLPSPGLDSNPISCTIFLTFYANLTKWPDWLTGRAWKLYVWRDATG
jgi:hypothetical protein